MAKMPEKGLVGLVYWENGFRNLTNSKRPITKTEDLAGVKLRVMQNPVYLESFNALGANAIPMAFSELFGALETKTVDGQENPFNTILSSKFYEVQKYVSVTNHVYSPWIVFVSKKYWDGLSTVSYTHLRAHETVLDLVCRLLLEQQNTCSSFINTHLFA